MLYYGAIIKWHGKMELVTYSNNTILNYDIDDLVDYKPRNEREYLISNLILDYLMHSTIWISALQSVCQSVDRRRRAFCP